jgi:hypothetical protein
MARTWIRNGARVLYADRRGTAGGGLVNALDFGWRSAFGRWKPAPEANGEPIARIVVVLSAALVVVAVALAWSLALARRQSLRR